MSSCEIATTHSTWFVSQCHCCCMYGLASCSFHIQAQWNYTYTQLLDSIWKPKTYKNPLFSQFFSSSAWPPIPLVSCMRVWVRQFSNWSQDLNKCLCLVEASQSQSPFEVTSGLLLEEIM